MAGLDQAEQGHANSSDEDNAAASPAVQVRQQPVSVIQAEVVLEIPGLGKTKWHRKRPDEIEVTCNAHSGEGCKKTKTILEAPSKKGPQGRPIGYLVRWLMENENSDWRPSTKSSKIQLRLLVLSFSATSSLSSSLQKCRFLFSSYLL